MLGDGIVSHGVSYVRGDEVSSASVEARLSWMIVHQQAELLVIIKAQGEAAEAVRKEMGKFADPTELIKNLPELMKAVQGAFGGSFPGANGKG